MSKKCEIRLAMYEDCPSLYNIHTSAIRQLCSTHYNGEEISQWAGRQNVERYKALVSEEKIVVGVSAGGEVVAFGNLRRENELIWEIGGLFVSPEHTGRGIASTLLRHFERQAKSEGCLNMTVKSTLNAAGFYEYHGYSRVKGDWHVVGGLSLQCVFMCKTL